LESERERVRKRQSESESERESGRKREDKSTFLKVSEADRGSLERRVLCGAKKVCERVCACTREREREI
jgi:hypothetical protein